MAAIVISNTGGTWTSTSTWVGGVVPVAGDTISATATSGNLTITTSVAAASIDFTNYVGTLAFTSGGLTLTGNLKFVSAMTITASSSAITIQMNNTATLTSAGKTIPCTLRFGSGATSTLTLADAASVVNYLGIASTSGGCVLNGFTLAVSGNLTIGTGFTNITQSGTTVISMTGSGTISHTSGCVIQNSLTINASGTIVFSGTVNYNTGTLKYITGTVTNTGSTLVISVSCTLDTNGITWNALTFSGASQTFTLASNLAVTGTLTFNGTTSTTVNGAFNITAGSNVTINNATHTVSAGASIPTIILNGNTTWTHTSTSFIGLNVTINTAGTLTFNGNGFRCNGTGTLVYTAGTVTGTLNLICNTYKFNCSSIIWSALTTASGTITLLADLNIAGNYSMNTNTQNINGSGFKIYIWGISKATAGGLTGSAELVFNGTGTWSDSFPTSVWSINTTINTSGTLTMGASTTFRTGTLKYVAGTVDVTTNSNTMTINQAATTLDTAGMSWNILVLSNTITINSLLTVGGTLSIGSGGTCTLNGTAGFSTYALDYTNSGRTLNLTAGITYIITNSFTCTAATAGSKNSIISTSTGAVLKLGYAGTQNVLNCNATWINSSGGQAIYTSAGALSNTTNWNIGVAPVASMFLTM